MDLVGDGSRLLANFFLTAFDRPYREYVQSRGGDFMRFADDMVVCDLDGFTMERSGNHTPALEVKMHSSIYKARPEVLAIVHTHARFCAVMSCCKTLVPMCQEGIPLVRQPLPVYTPRRAGDHRRRGYGPCSAPRLQ
jgi:ribulose-5-phosphate 4-epimerase/fuculose-1-phosphate aldolase